MNVRTRPFPVIRTVNTEWLLCRESSHLGEARRTRDVGQNRSLKTKTLMAAFESHE